MTPDEFEDYMTTMQKISENMQYYQPVVYFIKYLASMFLIFDIIRLFIS